MSDLEMILIIANRFILKEWVIILEGAENWYGNEDLSQDDLCLEISALLEEIEEYRIMKEGRK